MNEAKPAAVTPGSDRDSQGGVGKAELGAAAELGLRALVKPVSAIYWPTRSLYSVPSFCLNSPLFPPPSRTWPIGPRRVICGEETDLSQPQRIQGRPRVGWHDASSL